MSPLPGRRRTRRRLAGLAAVAALAVLPAVRSTNPATAAPTPRIGHVFVIVLENKGYAATFGNAAADPYLARTLTRRGALLTRYYGTGHVSNDNYIAMVSGQAPNPQNQGDCQVFSDFVGPGATVAPGQALGDGCVYPSSVPTLVGQLTARGLAWKGYMEDMGNMAGREAAGCGHPALGSQDGTQAAVAGDGYVTRHDPFVYFHSIIDDRRSCVAHVVPLGGVGGTMPASTPRGVTGLAADLRSVATTPNLSFVVPDVCDDGHDFPCTNEPSGASAEADTDAFLSRWVPLITGSPAFRRDGLLAVVFDESDGPQSDATACCNEMPGPDSIMPGITGPGGGRTGAVLLSPLIAPGTVSDTGYNHYSLLASLEALFGLPRLGMAQTVPAVFGADVFTAGAGG